MKNYSNIFFDRSGGFSKLWNFKILKVQTLSFYKPPSWWKTTQRPLLTKVVSFQSFEVFSKTWKGRLCWFCKPFAWWKTMQRPLSTKVAVSTIRKFKQWRRFVQIGFCNLNFQMMFLKLMSTLLKISLIALDKTALRGLDLPVQKTLLKPREEK